jgi:hypothetical protein
VVALSGKAFRRSTTHCRTIKEGGCSSLFGLTAEIEEFGGFGKEVKEALL